MREGHHPLSVEGRSAAKAPEREAPSGISAGSTAEGGESAPFPASVSAGDERPVDRPVHAELEFVPLLATVPGDVGAELDETSADEPRHVGPLCAKRRGPC